jgi:hypothetical protein
MADKLEYRSLVVEGWRLVVLPELWNAAAQREILKHVRAQKRAKHPQTIAVDLPLPNQHRECFLKVFHGRGGWAAVKDVFRESSGLRAWRQGRALAAAGFMVPVAIAAGEQRRARRLERAFILTAKINGLPVHLYLRSWTAGPPDSSRLRAKRNGLRRLAELLRRFHRDGFVHGDLVAPNIFVVTALGAAEQFYFMDNDRTRRYPRALPQSFWQRNLIQLNRMPLPSITLQDRMRFFHAYFGSNRLTHAQRKLARRLERQTRRRRAECDAVDASGSFRRLMRWVDSPR